MKIDSTDSKRAVANYGKRKYVHLVLVLSLPENSVVRLTDRPDITIAVCCGRKATTHTTCVRTISYYKGENLRQDHVLITVNFFSIKRK